MKLNYEGFQSRILTGDKLWFYQYDPEGNATIIKKKYSVKAKASRLVLFFQLRAFLVVVITGEKNTVILAYD